MKLTIFTPAYNRGDTLPRLYESLLEQSCFDFEWLIVDDGSTDNTALVVEEFLKETKFPVRYCYKENGGKHTAHNLALSLAKGKWFFCVDSDDYLTCGAVADLVAALDTESRGVAAYKQMPNGKLFSGEFPAAVTACHFGELIKTYGCEGEFSLVFPTDLLKKYPFPVFAGERFVTESVVYDRLDGECEFLLLPKAVTVCQYQEDGYSQNANSLMARNPNGYCLYFMQRVDWAPSFSQRVACAGKYWCFRLICKNPELDYRGKHPVLTLLCLPLGIVFRIYYKCIRGF